MQPPPIPQLHTVREGLKCSVLPVLCMFPSAAPGHGHGVATRERSMSVVSRLLA